MTTRIVSAGPSTGVSSTPTAPRQTPPPNTPFRQVMQSAAAAIVEGAESAARRLPGGSILAAALRPGLTPTPSDPGAASVQAEGSAGTAGQGAGTGGAAGGAAGGVEEALRHSADQNLYYLSLQERVSAENRSYSALSNVLKAQHDTVKNAIGNIR